MRGAWTVARREIAEKKLLFVGAIVLSVMPFLIQTVTARMSHWNPEMRGMTAWFFSSVYGAALAGMLGYFSLGADIADRRMAFYFSRPIFGWAIWVGKSVGGLAVVFGAMALTLLPTAVAGISPSHLFAEGTAALAEPLQVFLRFPIGNLSSGDATVAVLLAVTVLFIAGQLAGVVFRSRSGWLAADAILAVVVGLVSIEGLFRLFVNWAPDALGRSLGALAIVGCLALFPAGAAAATIGRIDIKRAHRALSATFWGLTLLAAICLSAFSRWVLAASPADLLSCEEVIASPHGDWIEVSGTARGLGRGGFNPVFLWNISTNEYRQIGPFGFGLGHVQFSKNGNRAAWLRGRFHIGGAWSYRLESFDLASATARPAYSEISIPFSSTTRLAISDDGSEAAVLSGDSVSVVSLPRGKTLAAARLPAPATDESDNKPVSDIQALSLSAQELLIYRRNRQPASANRRDTLEIFALEFGRRKLEKTGQIELAPNSFVVGWGDQAGILLANDWSGQKINALDARSGATRFTVMTSASGAHMWAKLLPDARVAVTESAADGRTLRLLRPDGTQERAIDLGKWKKLRLGSNASPDLLEISVDSPDNHGPAKTKLLLVNTSTGEVRTCAEGLQPNWVDPAAPSSSPGSEASKLFFDEHGALVRFDPMTGDRRTLVPGSH